MNRAGWLLLLLVWVAPATGQAPYFRPHTLGDEARDIHLSGLWQDSQGILWLGTSNGLRQYDGFRLAAPVADSLVSGASVTAWYEDSEGRFWIGSADGDIYRLDAGRHYVPFDPPEGHPARAITGIVEDDKHLIWFATYGEGVYVFDGNRIYNFNTDDGLTGNDIYDIAHNGQGEVWLATDDGISRCRFSDGRKEVKRLGLGDGLPDQLVTRLLPSPDGGMWIGTFEAGVVKYVRDEGRVVRIFPGDGIGEVTALALFEGWELWIGTEESRIFTYSPAAAKPVAVAGWSGNREGPVRQIRPDAEGNIWIAFENGHLYSAFRPFERIQGPPADLQMLLCDRQDRLWAGTRQGLFSLQDDGTFVEEAAVGSRNITDLAEDPFGNLWIGTLDEGLFVYKPGSRKLRKLGSVLRTGGSTIMSIEPAPDRMWLATLEGVVSYAFGEDILSVADPVFDLLQDPWESQLHFVFHIHVDPAGRVWFATDGNGVYMLEGDRGLHIDGNDSMKLRSVYAVCTDARGNQWFNTPDQGLVEYEDGRLRAVGVRDGLLTTHNTSIVPTSTGDLLVAHEQGIILMETARRHMMYYDDEIGASELQPALNAVAVDSRGAVYVGGRREILQYRPPATERSIHPRTMITEVSIFGQPVDPYVAGDLAPKQNYIAFRYIGLWYSSPASVKYLYKLEGYDLEWKESRDLVASYSDLRPGTYTFKVKASENNFFLDEPATEYQFTIRKPFWQQAWFVVLAALAGAGLVLGLIRLRDARAERQSRFKRDMLESQLAALKAQINPHFLFNSFNTLITLIDENAEHPGVAIEYVEKLSDFYRSILQYREQEMISLEEEWDLVQNFSYLLTRRYGNHLRLHLDAPPSGGYIIPLTLQILVENAVKHNVISATRPLDIHITVDPDRYVTVRNNLQPKSGAEPSTRFGLQSIMKRYQFLSDRPVVVEQTPENFVVRIPVINTKAL